MDNSRRVEQPNSDFSKKSNLDQNIKSKKKNLFKQRRYLFCHKN
jgi:hypothetical protein